VEEYYFDELCKERDRVTVLIRAMGQMDAYANPDGYIATDGGRTPEERLSAIWDILQSLRPTQS
jgi:hypothetical protein